MQGETADAGISYNIAENNVTGRNRFLSQNENISREYLLLSKKLQEMYNHHGTKKDGSPGYVENINEISNKFKTLRQEYEITCEKYCNLVDEKKRDDKKMIQILNQSLALKNDKSRLESTVVELTQRCQTLNTLNNSLSATNLELQNKYTELQNDMKVGYTNSLELKSQNKSLKEHILNLNSQLENALKQNSDDTKEAQVHMTKLIKKLKKSENMIIKQKEKVETQRQSIEDMSSELERTTALLQEAYNKMEHDKSLLEKKSNKIRDLKGEIRKKNEIISESQGKVLEYERLINSKNEELQVLRNSFGNDIATKDKDISKIRDEYENIIRINNENFQKFKEEKEKEIQAITKETEIRINTIMEDKEKEINSLIAIKDNDIEELNNLVTKLQKSRDAYIKEIESIRDRYEVQIVELKQENSNLIHSTIDEAGIFDYIDRNYENMKIENESSKSKLVASELLSDDIKNSVNIVEKELNSMTQELKMGIKSLEEKDTINDDSIMKHPKVLDVLVMLNKLKNENNDLKKRLGIEDDTTKIETVSDGDCDTILKPLECDNILNASNISLTDTEEDKHKNNNLNEENENIAHATMLNVSQVGKNLDSFQLAYQKILQENDELKKENKKLVKEMEDINIKTINNEEEEIFSDTEEDDLVSKFRKRLKKVRMEKQVLFSDKEELMARIQVLRTDFNERQQENINKIRVLERQIHETKQRNMSLESHLEATNIELNNIKSERFAEMFEDSSPDLRKHLADTMENMINIKESVGYIESQFQNNPVIQNLSQQINILEDAIEKKENKLFETQAELNICKEELQKKMTLMSTYSSYVQFAKEESKNLNIEKNRLEHSVKELNTRIIELEDESKRMRFEIDSLKNTITEKNQYIEELRGELVNKNTLTHEVTSPTRRLKESESERRVLEGKVASLNSEVRSLHERIKILEDLRESKPVVQTSCSSINKSQLSEDFIMNNFEHVDVTPLDLELLFN